MSPLLRVDGLDHVVINVSDMDRSVDWYRDVLGLEPVRLDEWRAGEAPFVSMRIDDQTIVDLQLAERTGENVDHLALVIGHWFDLEAIAASDLVEDVTEPRRLFGAQGWGIGIYVKDPDGNRIELRQYIEPGRTLSEADSVAAAPAGSDGVAS